MTQAPQLLSTCYLTLHHQHIPLQFTVQLPTVFKPTALMVHKCFHLEPLFPSYYRRASSSSNRRPAVTNLNLVVGSTASTCFLLQSSNRRTAVTNLVVGSVLYVPYSGKECVWGTRITDAAIQHAATRDSFACVFPFTFLLPRLLYALQQLCLLCSGLVRFFPVSYQGSFAKQPSLQPGAYSPWLRRRVVLQLGA